MTQEDIERIIREDVKVDAFEELYGVDRAAESIMMLFQTELERRLSEAAALYNQKAIEDSWRGSVDRMGGQFSQDEIIDSLSGGWR